jgi:transposase
MQITTIGFDIAKYVFQVHGIDADDKVVVRKQLRRSHVMAFFEGVAPCLVGMEACATAHHWARELTKLGHEVRLMPAKDVKAYVCGGPRCGIGALLAKMAIFGGNGGAPSGN